MESSPQNRVELITSLLQDALQPIEMHIVDQSHLHARHLEAKGSGGGHFKLTITCEQFEAKSLIERHKMVYAALNPLIGPEIHALSIDAKTPREAVARRSTQ